MRNVSFSNVALWLVSKWSGTVTVYPFFSPLPQRLSNAWPLQTWTTPESTGPNLSQISSTFSKPLSISTNTHTQTLPAAAHPERNVVRGLALDANPPRLPQPGSRRMCSGPRLWHFIRAKHFKTWAKYLHAVNSLTVIYNHECISKQNGFTVPCSCLVLDMVKCLFCSYHHVFLLKDKLHKWTRSAFWTICSFFKLARCDKCFCVCVSIQRMRNSFYVLYTAVFIFVRKKETSTVRWLFLSWNMKEVYALWINLHGAKCLVFYAHLMSPSFQTEVFALQQLRDSSYSQRYLLLSAEILQRDNLKPHTRGTSF